jgi:hypothetical protein
MFVPAAGFLLRSVLSLLSLSMVVPASAQMRDVENATPQVLTPLVVVGSAPALVGSSIAAPAQELLLQLTNLLELQPAQVVVVRRALAASLAAPVAEAATREQAAAPGPGLRALLTETQLARLQQWEAQLSCAERANVVATLR